jgi:hypothetical protein
VATAALVYFSAVKKGAFPALALIFTAMAFSASRYFWVERPMVTAHLVFAAALVCFEFAQGRKRDLGLLALGALWSNLNGSAEHMPAIVQA